MRQRDRAICLRTTDYSETSQVVHLLTRDAGAVRLLAKGTKRAKSKSGGMIDLLAEGDLVFIPSRSGGLGTLTEFSETFSHGPLRRDVRRLNAAMYMIELVGAMLGEDDPHPEVFDLLHNALARLEQPDAPARAVLAYFQWRLLKRVGLLGGMDRCAECNARIDPADVRAGGVYFSSRAGGMLCPACEASAPEKHRIDPQTLSGLATLAAAETGRRVTLPDAQADAVSRLLNHHVTYQIGRPLRTARFAISPS